MKRTLALLFAILTLLFSAAVPMQAFAKAPEVQAPEYLSVGVARNEAKKLYLRWSLPWNYDDGTREPGGYEIYRSTSGKSGTYQKIGTTRKLVYTDTGLKNGTVYYYRVRGYLKLGEKTYYSGFCTGSGCTKLTNAQATTVLQKAYRVAGMWMDLAQPNCNRNRVITKKRTITYDDGTSVTFKAEYYLVKNQKIQTKKQLKKYLSKYFDKEQVSVFVDDIYVEKDGKLWMYHFDWGDGAGPFAERDKVIYVSQTLDRMKFVNICNWGNDEDLFCDPVIHEAEFRNGRWILTDDAWFQYQHFIDLK